MADNINRTNGKDLMAYVGTEPWHKKGVSLGEVDVDSETMITAAGLDFPIELLPIFTDHKDGILEIAGKRAVVRGDTGAVFNVMSDRWEPVQNVDAFRFFDRVVGNGQAVYLPARLTPEEYAGVTFIRHLAAATARALGLEKPASIYVGWPRVGITPKERRAAKAQARKERKAA